MKIGTHIMSITREHLGCKSGRLLALEIARIHDFMESCRRGSSQIELASGEAFEHVSPSCNRGVWC